MNDNFYKRSWVEISLKNILNNIKIIKENLPNDAILIPVIKSNAYGHGDFEVAKVLEENGISFFAVSTLTEAINLRKKGIKGEILILGYTNPLYFSELIKYDITQTIVSEEYALHFPTNIKCHIALNTGMNRIGISTINVEQCVFTIKKLFNRLNVTGVFTHLFNADSSSGDADTKRQLDIFKKIVYKIQDLHIKYIHCMNSAGTLWQDAFGNAFRLGIILYGYNPSSDFIIDERLKKALVWKSLITYKCHILKNEKVGYGGNFIAPNDMEIATISTGYGDGYNRKLSNNGYILVGKEKAKIVGNICMDQFMVDVTNINCNVGDEVTLLNNEINANVIADLIGTISYEVLCAITSRVDRLYIE